MDGISVFKIPVLVSASLALAFPLFGLAHLSLVKKRYKARDLSWAKAKEKEGFSLVQELEEIKNMKRTHLKTQLIVGFGINYLIIRTAFIIVFQKNTYALLAYFMSLAVTFGVFFWLTIETRVFNFKIDRASLLVNELERNKAEK